MVMKARIRSLERLMTSDPLVLDEGADLDRALEILHGSRFRHLPVVGQDGSVVGMLSDRDLRLATSLLPARRRMMSKDGAPVPGAEYVVEIMRSPVHCLPPNASPAAAATDMIARRIGAIPVVGDELVGIVTETDLLRAYLDLNRECGGGLDDVAAAYMHVPLTTVSPEATVEEALELMDPDLGHLGVDDDGELVGIVSERDLFGGLARGMIRDAKAQEEGRMDDASVHVSDVMTIGAFTVGPQSTLSHSAKGMLQYKISALPVVEDGKPRGILTQRHVIEHFAALARADAESGRS
jgi:CBS domain-containing protein